MRLELHNSLRNPKVLDATRVVIYDAFNNPIAVAIEVEANVTAVAKLGDPDFQNLLQQFGITRTVLCHDVVPRDLRNINFE